MVNSKLKPFYSSVLSQTISECGHFLFVGNNFGDILVYSISDVYSALDDLIENTKNIEYFRKIEKAKSKPIQIFENLQGSKILSLVFYNETLIVGTSAVIVGFVWFKNQIQKKAWEVYIPVTNTGVDHQKEINCMRILNDRLYAGCGDNNVYVINLEGGKVERNFKGHSDYIHDVFVIANELYSASQDGTIRFWDSRQEQSTHTLKPYKNEHLARPSLGIWQGSVAVTNDWLLCGGGPKPSLWHLRSLECTTIYPFTKKVHVTGFLEDILYVAGDHNCLSQFSLNGDLISELSTSASSVYTVVTQQTPIKCISIGGTSNELNICSDLNYKDSVIKMYSN